VLRPRPKETVERSTRRRWGIVERSRPIAGSAGVPPAVGQQEMAGKMPALPGQNHVETVAGPFAFPLRTALSAEELSVDSASSGEGSAGQFKNSEGNSFPRARTRQ
jgi:hypothetical protein